MTRMVRQVGLVTMVTIGMAHLGCGGGAPMVADSADDSASDTATPSDVLPADLQEAASESAMSLVYIRVEGGRAAQQTVEPCPFGGSRVKNADGSYTLTECSIFPGMPMTGGLRLETGIDGGPFRMVADNLTGRNGDVEYEVDGFIEEVENDDGSSTFSMDFYSVTTTLRCELGMCFASDEPDEFSLAGSINIDEDFVVTGNLTSRDGSACSFGGENLLELVMADEPLGLDRVCFYPPLDDCVADGNCEIECRPPFADPDPDCTSAQLCTAYDLCDDDGDGMVVDNESPTMGESCADAPTNWGGFGPANVAMCFGSRADLTIERGGLISADEARINFPVTINFSFTEFNLADSSVEDDAAVLNGQVLVLTEENLVSVDDTDDTLVLPDALSCLDSSPGDDAFIVRYQLRVTDRCGVVLNERIYSTTCCGEDGGVLCGDFCSAP